MDLNPPVGRMRSLFTALPLLGVLGCAGGAQVTKATPQGPVLGADHIGLAVSDLEASKTFFIDVLGFRIKGEEKEYPAYYLENGHITITLWRVTDPATAIAFNRKANVGLHHLALGVRSFEVLEALHQRLLTYPGVKIDFAPKLSYGGPDKHMMFFEPSGNRLELVHRVPKN